MILAFQNNSKNLIPLIDIIQEYMIKPYYFI